jgi:hypothetical protein
MDPIDVTYYAPGGTSGLLNGRMPAPEDEIKDKRLKILKAYNTKGLMRKSTSEATLQRMKSESSIGPLSPIKVPKMKKFSHSPSPSFMGDMGKPPIIPTTHRWWLKEPTVCGGGMNVTHKRLSDVKNFTGSVKHNFHHFRRQAKSRGVVFTDDHADPFFPEDAFKFLQTSCSWRADQSLAIQRQGDLLSESTWRSQLRSDN